MNKTDWIAHLQLQPHTLEGGYFRRTYESPYSHSQLPFATTPRCLMTSIFYMLTDDNPIGYLHVNQADIMHYFHSGSALTYLIVPPDGQLQTVTMGQNATAGEQLQLLVKGGDWKASFLASGEFGLISEAVSPGFEYADTALVTQQQVQARSSQLWQALQKYVKP